MRRISYVTDCNLFERVVLYWQETSVFQVDNKIDMGKGYC